MEIGVGYMVQMVTILDLRGGCGGDGGGEDWACGQPGGVQGALWGRDARCGGVSCGSGMGNVIICCGILIKLNLLTD